MKTDKHTLRSEWLTMREDRYRPDFIPSEHPNLPPEYYDACVVEQFSQNFLSRFSRTRKDATTAWPLEWFVAVELEKGIYGTDRSLMHLIEVDEEGKPAPSEKTMKLLGTAYRSELWGVANLFDIPEDWDESKPWDEEPGNGLVLQDNWTYPAVEMLLDLKPGRGKGADMPQVGYQLWVGYEQGGTVEVAAITEDGTYSSDAQAEVPAVDVVVALFGPQETRQRASKFAPPTPPQPGRYDLYQVERVKVAQAEIGAEINEALTSLGRVEAEARQLIGTSTVMNRSDAALWIAEKEEGRARRIQQRNKGRVVFGS